jgi:hypothetical protein
MKKISILIIPLLMFLVIPVSVYAYNSNQNNDAMFNNDNITNETFGPSMMDDFDWMNEDFMYDMMNEIDCDNLEAHQSYLEEQKASINQQLLEGHITEEEATRQLDLLDQMIVFHEENHEQNYNQMMSGRTGCH